MTKNSSYGRGPLKKRLLKNGMLKNECYICGIKNEWNGKSLVMVLDHINGINDDNRLENLRMLCPNCNSQQDTFCGRRLKKSIPISQRGKCEECGIPIYKNAKRCKKCYGINLRKIQRPCKEELEKMINTMTWVEMGKKYGISDNAVKKWARDYKIDFKRRKKL